MYSLSYMNSTQKTPMKYVFPSETEYTTLIVVEPTHVIVGHLKPDTLSVWSVIRKSSIETLLFGWSAIICLICGHSSLSSLILAP